MAFQIVTVVLVTVAVGTPDIVLVKSIRDLWGGAGKRSQIVLKGLGALGIWFCVSWGMMFMLFVTVFGAAHSEYRLSHGGAANPSGSDQSSIIDLGYQKHHRINHSGDEFAKGTNHINGIEGFWGLAKVRLVKFRGLSKNTFYLHLKECEFRFNYRNHDLYKVLLKITREMKFC